MPEPAASNDGEGTEFAVPPFRHPPGLGNAHVQTFALLLPRSRGATRRYETLDVDVGLGAQVRLWCHWQPDPGAPTVVLLHGLTGSAASSYVVGLARKAFERGFHVVRYNARGSGDTEHLARPMTHYGLTADVAAVLERLRQEGRGERLHLIGYSMGGNLALKLAGEWGGDAPVPLTSIVAVSPAIAVRACALAIDARPEVRVYRDKFLRQLRRNLRRHVAHFDLGSTIDVDAALATRTIRGYDEAYTTPAWGFADVDDYWERASALPLLRRVAVPTLVLAARDDLLVPFDSLEPLWKGVSAAIRFVGTERGGHCAFVGRSDVDTDWFWAENRALEFVEAMEARR